VIDRRFWIADGRRAGFEAAFGRQGSWTRLLRRGDGYLETVVRCESAESGQYRVRDLWSWHRNFEIFRTQFQDEFERFEAWLRSERLIERELFLGAYYEKFEEGDEDDLVVS